MRSPRRVVAVALLLLMAMLVGTGGLTADPPPASASSARPYVVVNDVLADSVSVGNPAYVDVFDPPASLTIEYELIGAPEPNSYIRVTDERTVNHVVEIDEEDRTYSYEVDPEALLDGLNLFQVAYCVGSGGFLDSCTPPSQPLIYLHGARFDADPDPGEFVAMPYRQMVTPGTNVTLDWSDTASGATGAWWYLDVPDSIGSDYLTFNTSYQFQIPPNAPPQALYEFGLHSCLWIQYPSDTVCSNGSPIRAPADGVVSNVPEPPLLTAPQHPVFDFAPDVGDPTTIKASATGILAQVLVEEDEHVEEGDVLGRIVYDGGSTVQFVVGASSEWTTLSWGPCGASACADDPVEFEARERAPLTGGLPLDVTFGAEGRIWATAELSDFLTEVEGSVATTHTVPTAGNAQPFASWLGPTRKSALSEAVIEVDGSIWFTQGGDSDTYWLIGQPGPTTNHSRIVEYDPVEATFCNRTVPGDLNMAIGITWDGERIWFAEGHSSGLSRLSSFDPDEIPCQNEDDFSVDTEPCSVTATQPPWPTGCINQIEIPDTEQEILSHLEYDEDANDIWFTLFFGGAVGRYDLDTGDVDHLPLPESSFTGGLPALFGSVPWDLQVGSDHVYVVDYFDADLVRIDKSTGAMSEIHVPTVSRNQQLQGIELDEGRGRLWFTVSDGLSSTKDSGESGFGYVTLESFDGAVEGLLYEGMTDPASPEWSESQPLYASMAIDPCGDVALSNTWQRELLRFRRPLPADGFDRADGALVESRTELGDAQWSGGEDLEIISGEVVNTSAGLALATVPVCRADVHVSADVRLAGSNVSDALGVTVHFQDPANAVGVGVLKSGSQPEIVITETVDGVTSTLTSVVLTGHSLPSSPVPLEVITDGPDIDVYWNGSLVAQASRTDDSYMANAGRLGAGVVIENTGWHVDNFVVSASP